MKNQKVQFIINNTDGVIIPLAMPFTIEQADFLVRTKYSDKDCEYSFDEKPQNNSDEWLD